MDERENLPAKLAAQGLAATKEKHGGLVARGMAVFRKDNNALYRQARAVFDRGDGIRNWNAADDPAIFSAYKIFQRLTDENYGKAYYPLSILYSGRNDIEDGHIHATHYTQLALEWCLSNQANEDVELWCDLGDMHNCNGPEDYGVTQSKEIAEVWYRKAADKGYARAQWELGSLFCFCAEGHSDHSDRSAYYWMELAAHQGNTFYQICLAEYYEIFRWGELSESQQYQKAVYWYRMAAEQGDGCGQCCLGKMYEKGLGVDQNDELFVYWIRKAAEQGYGQSQWELGEMFANGRGVAQDNKQAEYWFRKAAEQNDNGDDQNNLGEMYMTGCGVADDLKQAVFWFRKAAEQGHEEAQVNLGMMYLEGCGVEQDDEQGKFWLCEAFSGMYEEDDENYEWYLDEQSREKYMDWTCNSDHWAQRFPLPLCYPLTLEDATLMTIVPEDVVVTLSHCGYMKAQKMDEYRAQRRGEQTTATNEGDFVENLFIANTHNYTLCFSNHGRVYWLKVYEVPQGSHISRGKPIMNLLPLEEGEKINAVFPVSEFVEDKYVFFATANGTVKKTPLNDFSRPMKRGIIAINLDEGDYLIGVAVTDGKDDVMLFSDDGKAVRFDENDLRPMGRASRGVRGMKLSEGQKIIALLVPWQQRFFGVDECVQSVLTVTENGYGKRTPLAEYTRAGRGMQGMIAIKTSAHNGKVAAAMLVYEDDEVMLITSADRMCRARVEKIRVMGRATQGATLINLCENEKVFALNRLAEPTIQE